MLEQYMMNNIHITQARKDQKRTEKKSRQKGKKRQNNIQQNCIVIQYIILLDLIYKIYDDVEL